MNLYEIADVFKRIDRMLTAAQHGKGAAAWGHVEEAKTLSRRAAKTVAADMAQMRAYAGLDPQETV